MIMWLVNLDSMDINTWIRFFHLSIQRISEDKNLHNNLKNIKMLLRWKKWKFHWGEKNENFIKVKKNKNFINVEKLMFYALTIKGNIFSLFIILINLITFFMSFCDYYIIIYIIICNYFFQYIRWDKNLFDSNNHSVFNYQICDNKQ